MSSKLKKYQAALEKAQAMPEGPDREREVAQWEAIIEEAQHHDEPSDEQPEVQAPVEDPAQPVDEEDASTGNSNEPPATPGDVQVELPQDEIPSQPAEPSTPVVTDPAVPAPEVDEGGNVVVAPKPEDQLPVEPGVEQPEQVEQPTEPTAPPAEEPKPEQPVELPELPTDREPQESTGQVGDDLDEAPAPSEGEDAEEVEEPSVEPTEPEDEEASEDDKAQWISDEELKAIGDGGQEDVISEARAKTMHVFEQKLKGH